MRWFLPAGAVATVLVALAVHAATGDIGGNDIPGVPLPESPFTGSLTTTTYPYEIDVDDVFGVAMGRNDRLDVTVTVPADADFDAYLFKPGTGSVVTALQPPYSRLLRYSGRRELGADESFTYVSNRSVVATHFLDVKQWEGSGSYTLEWTMSRLPAPTVVSTMPVVVDYRAPTSVTATITGPGGWPLSGIRAAVIAKPYGESSWRVVAEATSTPEGRLSFVVRPGTQTRYRVRTVWAEDLGGLDVGYGYGPIMTVIPRAYLTITSAPTRIARNTRFTVSGRLKPSHESATAHVRVGVWRRTKTGSWVFHRSFAANSTGTRWSARVSLPRGGTWRLRAVVAADAMHIKTRSAYRSLRAY